MKVIINYTVEFHAETGGLISLLSGERVDLPQPAIFLLNVLIKHPKVILSRDFIMEEAWEHNGLTVSGSNLSNYLGVLRRSFASLGLQDEIIRTMPRVGLRFNAEIEVVESDESDSAAKSMSTQVKQAYSHEEGRLQSYPPFYAHWPQYTSKVIIFICGLMVGVIFSLLFDLLTQF